ncbi:hypothetical protein GCM10023405_29880 [Streptomonospora salina]
MLNPVREVGMAPNIADLVGLDPSDPGVRREHAAVARDMDVIEALVERSGRRRYHVPDRRQGLTV